MDFAQTEEQNTLLDALEKLLSQVGFEVADGQRSFFSMSLDEALGESGLMDATAEPDFGVPTAALVVEQVSRLPAIVEVGASSFLRPLICPEVPRPLAVITGKPDRPARFLPQARSALFIGEMDVRVAELSPGDVREAAAFFAYPMGFLTDPAACLARAALVGDRAEVLRLLKLALACEIAGALQGALDAVTEHVRNRRQFGRPLGSFQAVRHRLARDASAITACRLLAYRAANLGTPGDAILALGAAQECATTILYDLHQFMGAMGLTLEHPLYRWSYRVKLLVSELGGPSRQLRDLAQQTWPEHAA